MSSPNRQLLAIEIADAPDAWEEAGFSVDTSGSLRLGRTVLRMSGEGGGIVGWSLDGVAVTIDGIVAVDPPPGDATTAVPSIHPNGISRIDHLVLRTGHLARTLAALESVGLEPRGGRTTTNYGSPMRQVFLWAGDVIIELIGPDDDEPTTDEETTFLGLALVADDLHATAEHMGNLLGAPKDAVQHGRRIAGVRGSQVGISVPLAVMSPHVRPEKAPK